MAQDVIDRRVFYAGQEIFREGSGGMEMFIVESGRVEITKGSDGSRKVLGQVGPGGVFGEMALIDDKPRMAGAIAVEATVLKVVDKKTFQANMKSVDPFMRKIIDVLTKNVRSLSVKLDGT